MALIAVSGFSVGLVLAAHEVITNDHELDFSKPPAMFGVLTMDPAFFGCGLFHPLSQDIRLDTSKAMEPQQILYCRNFSVTFLKPECSL